MIDAEGKKRCNTCGERLSTTAFYRASKGDGFGYRCKACTAASLSRFQAPELVAERQRRWAERNPERVRAAVKRYDAANREKRKLDARIRRQEKPHLQAAANRRWYVRHDGHARRKEWVLRNPEKALAIKLRRDAKRRAVEGVPDAATVDYAVLLRADPCAYCGTRAATVDHIVPLAAGGAVDHSNLTAACRPCNSRKNAKSLLVFLATRNLVA